MGVYIKNIQMPRNCSVCPLRMEWKDRSCGGCRAESIWYGPEDDEWKCKTRPNWCPLVPVPPHGDLIDRDALMDSDGDLWDGMWGWSGVQIANAPTVIPAEEEEDG